MLILAGVSLNAIIGDNGIITNAQNATILQNCAALEEFLNATYLSDELDQIIEYNEDGVEKTPLEKIIQKHPTWFFSIGSYNYVLSEYNYKDENGIEKTDFLMHRLLNINAMKNDFLCKDIIEQIKGGKADLNGDGNSDNEAYEAFYDVYGITNDLEVYYCGNGLETAKGADYTNASFLDGTKVIYGNTSGVAKAIAETKGIEATEQTITSLRSNTELIVSDTSGLNNLLFLHDLPNITKLTLTNYVGSLAGLEYATKLRSLILNNSNGNFHVTDWSGIKNATNLRELYFRKPTDDEADGLCSAMSGVDYSSLVTFGLYGYVHSVGNSNNINRGKNIVNASFSNNKNSLQKLSVETKKNITVLYLGNDSITGILDLSAFTGLTEIYLGSNSLTAFPILPVPEETKTYYVMDLGYNNINSISIGNKINITSLYIEGNPIDNIVNILNHGVNYCNAQNISDLDFSEYSETQKNQLSKINLILDSKYALAFPTYETRIPTNTTNSQFLQIKNSTNIKRLNLSGCTQLNDVTLQEVLSTLNLKKINLDNTNIKSLECLENSAIDAISIRGTSIVDLTPILSRDIGLIRLNNATDIVNFYNDADEQYQQSCKQFFKKIRACDGGGSSLVVFNNIDGNHGSDGLCCDSGADMALLINTFGIKNLYANYENFSYRGTIDVGESVLETAYFDELERDNSCSIILPNTITNLELERAGGTISCSSSSFSFSERNRSSEVLNLTHSKLSDVYLSSVILRGGNAINSTWQNIRIENFKFVGFDYNIAQLKYGDLSPSKTNNISINEIVTNNLTTNIDNMYIFGVKFNSLSSLNRFKTTENFYVWCCNLTSIGDFLSNNTNVKKLYLTRNLITEVDGLQAGSEIEYLDLSNNTLSNYTKIATGNKLTADIIAELPNLKWVSLEGNSTLTEFGKLVTTGEWINDGKNNFTRK